MTLYCGWLIYSHNYEKLCRTWCQPRLKMCVYKNISKQFDNLWQNLNEKINFILEVERATISSLRSRLPFKSTKTHLFGFQRIIWRSHLIKSCQSSLIFLLWLFLQALTLACLGLHYNSMSEHNDQHTVMLINGTFVGFSIILVGLFAGFIMNTPINKRIGKVTQLVMFVAWNSNKASIYRSFLLDRWMCPVHHFGSVDLAILERQ